MPRMKPEDLIRIASLAKIRLTEEEIAKYTKDLNDIVEYAEALKQVNIDNAVPMVSPLNFNTPFRQDVAKDSLTQEQALHAASQVQDGHFRVPRTVSAD